MRKKSVFSLITVLLAVAVQAQMPHRVAVLVNENSQNSKKAANVFAALHGVPGGNLIYLNLPESIVKGRAECTPEEFAQYIYDPAQKIIGERGLTNQVLAWVYSVDFPIRIVTSPNDRQQMSLIGLTFSRGKVPALEMVEKGQFISPLFAGPVNEGGPKNGTQSFDILSANLKEKMPLPSMMLGYTGENGTDMDTVLRCLQNGILARQSGFKTPVLLVQTDDKARSGPREWQYADVKTELAQRGGSAEIYTNQPPARTNLLGVLTGAENVKPADFGTFAPGAFCEHLTSWSAEFQKPQTKCTEWLKAGATVTAGMVTEPYANWLKFPHARFFVHYASGCSAMESFYQSIASPVQVLLLGDPLSQVAGIPVEIKTVGLSKVITSGLDSAFVAEAKFPVAAPVIYSALLDGKQIKEADNISLIELPFKEMGDGYHEVRIVAQALFPVTPGGFKDFPVAINKKGRSVSIAGIANGAARQIVVKPAAAGKEKPKEIGLLWNARLLDRKPYAEGAELSVDERILGEGPHRIQAVAFYEDGMEVRSTPQVFVMTYNPEVKAE
ncbi:MAG TPA: TIGR03790 family protein [Pontiellaceae bacterium]|nr:TIGR03790 family protein [Pontiellaceae bacterium]